jgi:hypothetical protein
MARPASLGAGADQQRGMWLPAFSWWPPADEFSLSVVFSTYHATVQPQATFHFSLRGYDGSARPVWEHDAGLLRFSQERAVSLAELGVPPAPARRGGVLEVHISRVDAGPKGPTGIIGAWIDAAGRDGGGYILPTIPIQGQTKVFRARDDLQVIPGVVSSPDTETELVVVNPIGAATKTRLVVASSSGLVLEGEWFSIAPWSAWRSSLSDELLRVRQLLASDGGVGSLSIYSTHKVLPYFGFRRAGNPVTSMDHAAPIFV